MKRVVVAVVVALIIVAGIAGVGLGAEPTSTPTPTPTPTVAQVACGHFETAAHEAFWATLYHNAEAEETIKNRLGHIATITKEPEPAMRRAVVPLWLVYGLDIEQVGTKHYVASRQMARLCWSKGHTEQVLSAVYTDALVDLSCGGWKLAHNKTLPSLVDGYCRGGAHEHDSYNDTTHGHSQLHSHYGY